MSWDCGFAADTSAAGAPSQSLRPHPAHHPQPRRDPPVTEAQSLRAGAGIQHLQAMETSLTRAKPAFPAEKLRKTLPLRHRQKFGLLI